MNLQDKGMRYVLRVVDGHIDGRWMDPESILPQWLDCTDMSDDLFCRAIQRLQILLSRNKMPSFDYACESGCNGCEQCTDDTEFTSGR
jgi:hypothetical protein